MLSAVHGFDALCWRRFNIRYIGYHECRRKTVPRICTKRTCDFANDVYCQRINRLRSTRLSQLHALLDRFELLFFAANEPPRDSEYHYLHLRGVEPLIRVPFHTLEDPEKKAALEKLRRVWCKGWL